MAKSAALLATGELWTNASTLHFLPEEPQFLPLQLSTLNQLFLNGLTRGIITEINGPRSSGRTSLYLHILAQATTRGEVCAVIDIHDGFHPASAHAAGVTLERLLWVRCRGNAEHAMRTVDLLLHAGGFGVVLLDLCETPMRMLNRIPLSHWYRFRRAMEHAPTIFIVCAESAQAKVSSSSRLQLKSKRFRWSGEAPFLCLRGLDTNVILHKGSAFRSESLSILSRD